MSLPERLNKVKGDVSIADVARRTGFAQVTTNNYFRGREPSVKFLLAFAEEFGVSLHWLITGRGQPEAPSEEVPEPAKLVALVTEGALAREVAVLYGPDAPQDLDALLEAQMGVIKCVKEMGADGKKFADLILALYELQAREPEKYEGLLKLLGVEGEGG